MNTNGDVKVGEMIDSLKAKAKHFEGLAKALEIESGLHKAINVGAGVPMAGNIDAQKLRDFMKTKAFRVLDLAKHFGVAREDVDKLVTEENGFSISGPGWVYVKEKEKVTV